MSDIKIDLLSENKLKVNFGQSSIADHLSSLSVINGTRTISDYSISNESNVTIVNLNSNINIFEKTYVMFNNLIEEVSYLEYYDSNEFNEKYATDTTLGYTIYEDYILFRLWSPVSSKVDLCFYKYGSPSEDETPFKIFTIERPENGLFEITVPIDYKNTFYTYKTYIYSETYETIDPYAKSAGINGIRGYVVDFEEITSPEFKNHTVNRPTNFTSSIIYETSVRDATINPSNGIKNKGKLLGLSEENTVDITGVSTGLSHFKELGITHLQLMPIFDFHSESIDETFPYKYNWGYDPQNYNVIEGSYSTDSYDPLCRIKELKEVILTYHKNGLFINMDVVYNHVYKKDFHPFQKVFPDYFFRKQGNEYSNGSGLGNDIKSERMMVRKYIVDSVLFWASEYKIDGFRFDLMGLLDVDTMREVRNKLNEIDHKIMVYGEGWNLSTYLPDNMRATIENASKIPRIAFFNNRIRDVIAGDIMTKDSRGFINGLPLDKDLAESLTGNSVTLHHNNKIFDSPMQSINYVTCHDNYTLWDKITLNSPFTSENERSRLQKLAIAIVLFSQGIPFLNSGIDFCRTKNYSNNTYNSSDIVNWLDYSRKVRFKDVFEYTKNLIALRKKYSCFQKTTIEDINSSINIHDVEDNGVLTCSIKYTDENDNIRLSLICINNNKYRAKINIPNRKWQVFSENAIASITPLYSFEGENYEIPNVSLSILFEDI